MLAEAIRSSRHRRDQRQSESDVEADPGRSALSVDGEAMVRIAVLNSKSEARPSPLVGFGVAAHQPNVNVRAGKPSLDLAPSRAVHLRRSGVGGRQPVSAGCGQ